MLMEDAYLIFLRSQEKLLPMRGKSVRFIDKNLSCCSRHSEENSDV